MPIDHSPSRHQLRACVEALVAGAPAGITTLRVHDELIRRVAATDQHTTGSIPVLRILGQLLVEGRIDERDGVWVPRAQAAPLAHPEGARRAA